MSESGFTPPDGGDGPPHFGEPPRPQGPPERHTGWVPPRPPPWAAGRPQAVTAASVLWIILGGVLIAGAIGEAAELSAYAPDGAGASAGGFVIVVGVVLIILATRMRRGKEGARTALTVIGSILMLALWPILLVVPALILQFRPDNKAWFAANRPPPPGPWRGPNP